MSTHDLPGAVRPDLSDHAARRRNAVLGLVLVAQFMVILDATIVTVALPSIQGHLHFGSQLSLQWVINAYILLFGGFLLFGGRAGDLFGRQRLFVVGLVVFTAASLVNGLAQSPGMLIAGRTVQGLGAALVSPAVLSIIIVTFEGAAERAKALGVFSAVTAAGSAAGILAGGLLTNYLSWRAIFLVNVPIGLLALIGALRIVPNSKIRDGGLRDLDVPGAVTVTAGVTLLVYTIVNAASWGWGSTRAVWLFVASAVLLTVFVLVESKSPIPLVRLGLFKLRAVTASNITMFLFVGGLYVMMFFPTLYLAQVKGYSPIKVGLAYLPWPVAMAVAGGVAQKLIARLGPKYPLVAGLVIIAGGLFSMAALKPDSSYAAGTLPGMLLTAIGAGLAWAALFLVSAAGVPPEESGLASGVVNTSQQVGAALGLAALSSVAAAHTAHLLHAPSTVSANTALVDGFQRGFFIGAVVLLASAAVAMLGLRRFDGYDPTAQAAAAAEVVDVPVPVRETDIAVS